MILDIIRLWLHQLYVALADGGNLANVWLELACYYSIIFKQNAQGAESYLSSGIRIRGGNNKFGGRVGRNGTRSLTLTPILSTWCVF